MRLTQETYEEWLANPVTEAVFRVLAKLESEEKEEWLALSWDRENPDPLKLAYHKGRANAFRELLVADAIDIEVQLNADSN
jgi:hypothetical protein